MEVKVRGFWGQANTSTLGLKPGALEWGLRAWGMSGPSAGPQTKGIEGSVVPVLCIALSAAPAWWVRTGLSAGRPWAGSPGLPVARPPGAGRG